MFTIITNHQAVNPYPHGPDAKYKTKYTPTHPPTDPPTHLTYTFIRLSKIHVACQRPASVYWIWTEAPTSITLPTTEPLNQRVSGDLNTGTSYNLVCHSIHWAFSAGIYGCIIHYLTGPVLPCPIANKAVSFHLSQSESSIFRATLGRLSRQYSSWTLSSGVYLVEYHVL